MKTALTVCLLGALASGCATKTFYQKAFEDSSVLVLSTGQARAPVLDNGKYLFAPTSLSGAGAAMGITFVGALLLGPLGAGLGAAAGSELIGQETRSSILGNAKPFEMPAQAVQTLRTAFRTEFDKSPRLRSVTLRSEPDASALQIQVFTYFLRNVDETTSIAFRFINSRTIPGNTVTVLGAPETAPSRLESRQYDWISSSTVPGDSAEPWLANDSAALVGALKEAIATVVPVLMEEIAQDKLLEMRDNQRRVRLADTLGPKLAFIPICARTAGQSLAHNIFIGEQGMKCFSMHGYAFLPRTRFVEEAASP